MIPLLNRVKVTELEPFDICLINNTETEVEFDILKKVPIPKPEPIKRPSILNGPISISTKTHIEEEETQVNVDDTPTEKLSREEIRMKRLAFYAKK